MILCWNCYFTSSVFASIPSIWLGWPCSLHRRPHTYLWYIPLKNRLRTSHKNSLRVTYYLKLFATCTEFLWEGRSLFFSGIYNRYMWGLLRRLRGPNVILGTRRTPSRHMGSIAKWLTRLATHPEIERLNRANTHGPLTHSPTPVKSEIEFTNTISLNSNSF